MSIDPRPLAVAAHRRGRGRRLATVIVAVALVAGCGDDDDAAGDASSGDATTGETAAATSEPSGAAATTADAGTDAPAGTDATSDTDAPSGTADAPAGARANEPGAACIGSGDGSGEPIVIGQIQTDESAAAGFPELSQGAEACFEAINETGGIDGRPIDFRPCNDAADPVQGESCARDLIDAGAVAVLGGICFSCFSAPVVDILGEAGVPYVGGLPVLPNEYTQENFYPITNAGGSAALFANSAYIMSAADANGVDPTVVEVYAAVGEADPTLENKITELGGTYVARIGFDPASSDLSSIAQQAIDEDANFVSVQTDGPNTVKLVTALRSQGYEGEIVILGTAADPQSIEGMGAASEGVFVATFFEDLATGTSPDATKYQADMAAVDADAGKTLAATGYAAALVTAEGLFAAGEDVTSESFLEALFTVEDLQPLFGGRLSAGNANDDFPRTFYFTAFGNTIVDGAVTPTGEAFDFYTGEPLG